MPHGNSKKDAGAWESDRFPDGKTSLRIVGLGFGPDEEWQRMKEFFRQGNAYTLGADAVGCTARFGLWRIH